MSEEVERKFLVDDDRWRQQTRGRGTEITQGYLHVDGGVEIRVRLRGADDAVLTVKRGGPGQVRQEVEVSLDRAEAGRLLDEATTGGVIAKRRHLVDLPMVDGSALTAEVDEFAGEHEGLVLAEVELPAPDAALPDVEWFGTEVTGDERYYNATLALEGPPGS